MTKTKVILFASFLLAFAAGTSVGVLITGRGGPPRHRSWLTAELNLSPEQREEMGKIWREAMGSGFRQQAEQRAAMAQQRDQAILSLLSETQRARYEAIQQEHADKMEELSRGRKRAFEEAVERTKRILTPEQVQKYDELMKKQRERGTGSAPSGFHGPRHRRAAPGSRPVTDEQLAPRGGE